MYGFCKLGKLLNHVQVNQYYIFVALKSPLIKGDLEGCHFILLKKHKVTRKLCSGKKYQIRETDPNLDLTTLPGFIALTAKLLNLACFIKHIPRLIIGFNIP
jgi:hypothetical protein